MNPNPKTARQLWRVLAILGLLALPVTAAITRESPSIAQEVTVGAGLDLVEQKCHRLVGHHASLGLGLVLQLDLT